MYLFVCIGMICIPIFGNQNLYMFMYAYVSKCMHIHKYVHTFMNLFIPVCKCMNA